MMNERSELATVWLGPDVAGDGFAVAELEGELPLRLVEDGVTVRRDQVDVVQSRLVDEAAHSAAEQVPVVDVQARQLKPAQRRRRA